MFAARSRAASKHANDTAGIATDSLQSQCPHALITAPGGGLSHALITAPGGGLSHALITALGVGLPPPPCRYILPIHDV